MIFFPFGWVVGSLSAGATAHAALERRRNAARGERAAAAGPPPRTDPRRSSESGAAAHTSKSGAGARAGSSGRDPGGLGGRIRLGWPWSRPPLARLVSRARGVKAPSGPARRRRRERGGGGCTLSDALQPCARVRGAPRAPSGSPSGGADSDGTLGLEAKLAAARAGCRDCEADSGGHSLRQTKTDK